MASAPQPQLPLFYNDLMPLNSRDHASWKILNAEWIAFPGTAVLRDLDVALDPVLLESVGSQTPNPLFPFRGDGPQRHGPGWRNGVEYEVARRSGIGTITLQGCERWAD